MNPIARLLYISGYALDGNSGAAEHVREIAFHLANLGWQVTLVGLANDGSSIFKNKNIPNQLRVVPVELPRAGSHFGVLSLWRTVAQVTKQYSFDLAYIRPARKTLLAIRWLKWKKIPYVVEVNTKTAAEHQAMESNPITATFADWLEKLQFSHAAGAFCITQELAQYVRERIPQDAPTWITGNGFCAEITRLATFEPAPREVVGITDQETVVTFLANLQPWHGVDLLLETLSYMPDVRLWVIGDGPEKPKVQAQASQLGVESRIHWWGYQHGDKLQELLSASDIAICFLALHRKNMYEAQPLKVRHFLGVGLPTIIGYKDTLLNENSPGVFYAQTAEEIADRIKEIQKQGNMRSTEYRQQIRNFALQHLSWAAIAKQTSDILLEWLNSKQK